jgi:hypothetical protein
MFNIIKSFILNLLILQENYIFPNKNASIEWNNTEYYNLNLSIIDNNLNQIFNQEIGLNKRSPFVWNVPNFINNFTYYNKNVLFIQNNNVIDSQNINNYGVLVTTDDKNLNFQSNYNCEYFNLSLNNNESFIVYDKILVLNQNYIGFYDITITSNDNNLFVFEQIDLGNPTPEDEYNLGFFIFKIIMLSICGIAALTVLYLLFYYILYIIHKVFGINLLKKWRERRYKKKHKNRIYPSNIPRYNNNGLRRRLSTTDYYNNKNNNNFIPNFNQFENEVKLDSPPTDSVNNVFI